MGTRSLGEALTSMSRSRLSSTLDALEPQHRYLEPDACCETCGRIIESRLPPGFLAARDMEAWQLPACRCAVEEEKRRSEARRLTNLPGVYSGQRRTFENFRPVRGTEEALEAARHFALQDEDMRRALVLVGNTGSGKSHLLEAIGWECLAKGERPRYEYVPELLDLLRGAMSDSEGDSYETIQDRCILRSPLLLDDIGAEKGTEWARERLTRFVDERLRRDGRLAVATNLTQADLARRDAGAWARLASRVFGEQGGVRVVAMTAGDYRVGGEA